MEFCQSGNVGTPINLQLFLPTVFLYFIMLLAEQVTAGKTGWDQIISYHEEYAMYCIIEIHLCDLRNAFGVRLIQL